jgi:hypothetical protein
VQKIDENVVRDVCTQFSQGGMRFDVVRVDDAAGRLDLALGLDGVECLDCVMPADHLTRLISASLTKRLDRAIDVSLRDPRADSAAPAATAAGTVTVLDPTATGRGGDMDPGPDLGSLRGKRILFRVDSLWRSWDWTVDEWTKAFTEAGAEVVSWRRWQGIPDSQGAYDQADYEALVGTADAVISGLGNCGSCSAWTIRDALTGLNAGLPTVAVATEHFVPLAGLLAEDGRRPGLRIFQLPYPLDTRPEEEVRGIAKDAFPRVLELIGAEVAVGV